MEEYILYNGKVKINFTKGRHIFKDSKGNYILSVTGATGIIDKSGPLLYWATEMMGDYLIDRWKLGEIKRESEKIQLINKAKKEWREAKQKAADIGNEIHEWVSDWILKKNPEMPEDEKVVNGITAFLKFQKKHKIKWLESERVIYSKKHNYAGFLDAVGIMDNKLTLIDFKSSKRIYDEMKFQVAGYQIAYEEETGKKFDERMIVKFGKETGEFEYEILEDDEKDKKTFLACLSIKKRLKELQKPW